MKQSGMNNALAIQRHALGLADALAAARPGDIDAAAAAMQIDAAHSHTAGMHAMLRDTLLAAQYIIEERRKRAH